MDKPRHPLALQSTPDGLDRWPFPNWRHLLVSEVICDMPEYESINLACRPEEAEGKMVKAAAVAELYQRSVTVWVKTRSGPVEYGGVVPHSVAKAIT